MKNNVDPAKNKARTSKTPRTNFLLLTISGLNNSSNATTDAVKMKTSPEIDIVTLRNTPTSIKIRTEPTRTRMHTKSIFLFLTKITTERIVAIRRKIIKNSGGAIMLLMIVKNPDMAIPNLSFVSSPS